MSEGVAIIGIGLSGFSPKTKTSSYKELTFEAARRAYTDAGIEPRKDVGSFVCCAEDLWEGNSISDEYTPDQMGAALRPTCTVSADGVYGIATAFMQIKAGLAEIAVVEAHSKASNVLNPEQVIAFALDSIFARGISKEPLVLAGLEMNRFMHESGNPAEAPYAVISKNLRNALLNPRASYANDISMEGAMRAGFVARPLRRTDVSRSADGCVVAVLASERIARRAQGKAVWIRGIGWSSGSPWVQEMVPSAEYAQLSARMACNMAGDETPRADFYELDDTFSYKELQHMEAIGLAKAGESGRMTIRGETARSGSTPVNVSGGSLGVGHLLEATGLHRVAEACLQLRGEAGQMQLGGVRRAFVQSWRGLPTASGGAVILEVE